MKIYTRTGDGGETSLFAGGRVRKDNLRLHAYGTIDELNSMLGLVLTHPLSAETSQRLTLIQNELFVVGSDLATPSDASATWIVRMSAEPVERLEHEIDAMEAHLTPLNNFILPGGIPAAAALHVARTICRRAERWIVSLGDAEAINGVALQYVNRLSDWLFVAARYENRLAGHQDTIWKHPEHE
ncbi:MAG TPA: cob(I)yrinic acid a,c-diamide adenosyltransferase [Aggregatilineales bacterium]|nr:cob(I)yrinic acid a,c-diamide adenosyltransferase [Aggregatilineales bacterium]